MHEAPQLLSISHLAAAVLQSMRAGNHLVEEACDLAVADSRFNVWAASFKQHAEGVIPASFPNSRVPTNMEWDQVLEELESIHNDLWRAWSAFETSDWPRGQYQVWAQHSETFLAAMRNARTRIDALGKSCGRSNQRVVPTGQ